MQMKISASARDYFVGHYAGPYNTSPFETVRFDSVAQAMLYVKSKMDYFQTRCYGFVVYTDRKVKEGRHYIHEVLLRWHNDGTDCGGELVNPAVGWRICIDADNHITEEHFTPKEET